MHIAFLRTMARTLQTPNQACIFSSTPFLYTYTYYAYWKAKIIVIPNMDANHEYNHISRHRQYFCHTTDSLFVAPYEIHRE